MSNPLAGEAFSEIFRCLIYAGILITLPACKDRESGTVGNETATAPSEPISPWHDVPGATYVGVENCKSCHEAAFNDWLQS